MLRPKALLIYPPTQLMRTEMPRPDGSLGILYLTGALLRAGIEADVLDATVGTPQHNLKDTFYRQVEQENGLIKIGLSEVEISELIANGGYNIVCISCIFTPQTRMALMVARAAKAVSTDILVVAGGVNARSLPEMFFDAGVDVICATEGEEIIVKIAHAFAKGEKYPISGTIVRDEGRIVRHPIASGDVHKNLDKLPMPAWYQLPFEHYDDLSGGGRAFERGSVRTSSMMTSRGCPFECLFCHISNEKEFPEESGDIGSLRLKSEDRVVAELEHLKHLGVRKVFLEDDSLLAKKARIKRIFSLFRDQGMQLADVNGVNLVHFLKGGGKGEIDKELLELLYEAGMHEIVFPVESANQRVVKKYATDKLNHTKLDVVELVRVARDVGITTPINMMIGFPDETEEEIRETIALGKRLVDAGAPYCSLYIPIPFPGSRLFTIAIQDGYLDKNFNPDDFNWRRAVMKNTTVPPHRIQELQSEGWHTINPPAYVEARLQKDIGLRWKPKQ